MFKNLLVRLANIIINKYGIHILDNNSIIQVWDARFRIQSYNISKNLCEYNKINLEGIDIISNLDIERI